MLQMLSRFSSRPLFAVMLSFIVLLTGLSLLQVSPLEVLGQDHNQNTGEPRPELERESPVVLLPETAGEIGSVYQAFLSPQQQGAEEDATPRITPPQFRSTEPSTPREERPGRGHAVIEFTNDLSRAYVHLAVTNVNADDIVMLHLHCGRPGQLGPIIIDFGMMGDLTEYLADGMLTLEITNADIEAVVASGSGVIGAFTAGCPIVTMIPNDNFTTIGGLEYVARQGELYMNLHTAAQTFYGDIRGAFRPVALGDA